MKSGIIGTYFSTPSFYKKALRLALPICLQQALNQGASFLDTMMVSHVGGVGAVTVATQIDNLLMLVGFGVNSCILIFASQFFGAGNRRNLKRCFGLQLLLNVCIALAFFLLAKLGGTWFLSFFSDDARLIELAKQYISISAFSYFFTALINGYTFMYRSVQTTKVPMLLGLATNCLNALLNYLLIFGKLGLPALGVRGAAIATVIATFCGLAGHVTYAFVTRQPFLGFAGELFRWPSTFLRPIFRRMIPMAGNEIVFGLGDAMYLKAFGMLGTAMLEAYQVAYKIGMVPHTIADGMGSASGILLGEHLGRGESEKARSIIRYLFPLAIGLSVVVSAVMILIARPVVSIFALPDSSVDVAVLMVRLFNIRIATRMFNAVLLSAVRAGGDTKFLLFMDSGLVWLVGIPAAYIGLLAFGMLGTAMLEAYQVAYKIGMVPHTIADGMGSASGILLGEHLGRGESEKARSIIRYLFPLAIGLSVVVSAVMILIARPVVSIFALPDSSVDVAVLMVRLFNIRIATRMFNAVLLSAVRAGGDTKFLLFMDSGLVWLVGIPAAYIGLLVLGVDSLPVLFLLTQSEQVVRMIIGLLRCRSGKWLHNLTEETGTQ